MAEVLISGATSTGTAPSNRKKRDITGGPKRPVIGFSCPIVKRGKKKKLQKGGVL